MAIIKSRPSRRSCGDRGRCALRRAATINKAPSGGGGRRIPTPVCGLARNDNTMAVRRLQTRQIEVGGRGRCGGEGRGARMIGKKGEEDGVVYGDAQREAEGVPEV